MRKEELLALRWEQVDLDASTIELVPDDTKTNDPGSSSSRSERRTR
jgi:integrase